MKSTAQQKPGFILILTLSIISLCVIVITLALAHTRVYLPFARFTVDREKAALLAISGVQAAMSQLATPFMKEETAKNVSEQEKKEESDEEKKKKFLKLFLSISGQWQRITFEQKKDGMEGEIQFCIVAEHGKININEIYDFKNKKFVGEGEPRGDYKKIMQELCKRIEAITNSANLFNGFEKFLKERQYRLNDVTELLTIKEFESLKRKIDYKPAVASKETTKKEKELYLTDIFTIFSSDALIDPWVLSVSMMHILDLHVPKMPEEKEKIDEALKKFASPAPWSTQWKETVGLLYGKDIATLPAGFDAILAPVFNPQVFSILVESKVGKVKQKMIAIIALGETVEKETKKVTMSLKKLYWL